MVNQIFRQEALDAKRADMFGGVVIAHPPAIGILTTVVSIFMAAIGILLMTFSYTEKVGIHGQLVGRESRQREEMPTLQVATAGGHRTGNTAAPGKAPVAFAPGRDDLMAQLYVPASTIRYVQVGQDIRLRLQAYPHQKFGRLHGRVTAISHPMLARQAIGTAVPGRDVEPVYRIDVDLTGQKLHSGSHDLPMLPGMVVSADIRQETRRLYEWAVKPLRDWATVDRP